MTSRRFSTYFFRVVMVGFFIWLTFSANVSFALEKSIIIPAEDPQGVVVDLEPGEYTAKIAGGAIAICYPINPNYRWLIGVAVGADVEGGQDEPNLGTLYFEPDPAVYTQTEAQEQVLAAVQQRLPGTYLKFSLKENRKVRFWVSDFDYTDNSGMIKLKIQR